MGEDLRTGVHLVSSLVRLRLSPLRKRSTIRQRNRDADMPSLATVSTSRIEYRSIPVQDFRVTSIFPIFSYTTSTISPISTPTPYVDLVGPPDIERVGAGCAESPVCAYHRVTPTVSESIAVSDVPARARMSSPLTDTVSDIV